MLIFICISHIIVLFLATVNSILRKYIINYEYSIKSNAVDDISSKKENFYVKILILTDRLDVGGAETHIAELSRGLKKRGEEVELLSAGGKAADRLAREGFAVHRLPFRTHNPIRILFLRRQLRKLLASKQYDVIHAHARLPAFLLRGIKHGNALRIVTVHARFRTNRLLRRLCYWGDYTVAVSEDLRTYVCRAYRVPPSRICVIPNGIDCEVYAPDKERTAEEPRILFSSRLDADCSRGAELLLQIAPVLCESYPTLSIGIAGGGDCFEALRLQAEAINRSLGREAVILYGHVDEMAALLKKQSIVIGVSRVAMESAACGCAVLLCGNEGYLGILSNDTRTDAMLSNFCCRGCGEATALRLEEDLRLLLASPTLQRRLGAEARELIRSELDAEKMCADVLACYRRHTTPTQRRELLIGGYFGCGNVGDDAILYGFLEGMHRIAPDVRIRALTARPRTCRKKFGIDCIERRNPLSVWRAMRRADVFLCGGGSLLQNTTGDLSLRYYLLLLSMAKRARCITALYAAGIGPLRGKSAEQAVKSTLNACDYISLRDPESLRYLTRLGVDRTRLHEGADPALLLPLPPPTRGAAILRAHRITSSKVLCVVLRRSHHKSAYLWRSVVAAAEIYCKRHGATAIFPVFSEEEKDITALAATRIGGVQIRMRDPADLASLLRECDAVLSMRLHPLILAAASATPALGLSIDPTDSKMVAFCRLSSQPMLAYEAPSVGEITDFLENELHADPAKAKQLLGASVTDLQKKALRDLENIVEMIYNIP